MLGVYNKVINAGATFTSEPTYLTDSGGVYFVNGATATMTVQLEVAYVPTSLNQNVVINPNDWIAYSTAITSNNVSNTINLNNLWARLTITNSGGSNATITAFLG